LQRKA
jgi:hypothetical protein